MPIPGPPEPPLVDNVEEGEEEKKEMDEWPVQAIPGDDRPEALKEDCPTYFTVMVLLLITNGSADSMSTDSSSIVTWALEINIELDVDVPLTKIRDVEGGRGIPPHRISLPMTVRLPELMLQPAVILLQNGF
jgi:hypothetical protein